MSELESAGTRGAKEYRDMATSDMRVIVVPWWSSQQQSCRGQLDGLWARQLWRPSASRTVLLECLSAAAADWSTASMWAARRCQNCYDQVSAPCSLLQRQICTSPTFQYAMHERTAKLYSQWVIFFIIVVYFARDSTIYTFIKHT